jgi:hypothetical protein
MMSADALRRERDDLAATARRLKAERDHLAEVNAELLAALDTIATRSSEQFAYEVAAAALAAWKSDHEPEATP